jgi:hypothetical protein
MPTDEATEVGCHRPQLVFDRLDDEILLAPDRMRQRALRKAGDGSYFDHREPSIAL